MCKTYVVEFSASQGAFHIDELQRILRLNRINAQAGRSVDYMIIGLFNSDDEAMKYCKEFQKTISGFQVKNLSDVNYDG